jgi:hypothetical protein
MYACSRLLKNEPEGGLKSLFHRMRFGKHVRVNHLVWDTFPGNLILLEN